MSYPSFLDFEASSLHQASYPIEVAWNNASGQIHSHLIIPDPTWTDWSQRSEEIHGITKQELYDSGQPIYEVCEILRTTIKNTILYSDAPDFEDFWMNRLFQAGEKQNHPFTIRSISTLDSIYRTQTVNFCYSDLKKQAQKAIGTIHRAAADVEAFMHVYNRASSLSRS